MLTFVVDYFQLICFCFVAEFSFSLKSVVQYLSNAKAQFTLGIKCQNITLNSIKCVFYVFRPIVCCVVLVNFMLPKYE